jgi:hypothetical protein
MNENEKEVVRFLELLIERVEVHHEDFDIVKVAKIVLELLNQAPLEERLEGAKRLWHINYNNVYVEGKDWSVGKKG